MNTTPTIKQMLLALAVGFAVTGAVLLLWDRNSAAGTEPPGCGPQELTVSESTASVDPEGCEVVLTVWSSPPDARNYTIPSGDTLRLPQTLETLVQGTDELSVQLPCGWYQVDVFDTRALQHLTSDNIALINRNPDAFVQWLNDHPEFVDDLNVLDTVIGERTCTPDPVVPPVDVGVKPLIIDRTDPAVPVVAEPQVTG